jgi:hypothetical protein
MTTLVLVAIVGVIVFGVPSLRYALIGFLRNEPFYKWRPVSYWISQLGGCKNARDEGIEALKVMGADAVPYLLKELSIWEQLDSRSGDLMNDEVARLLGSAGRVDLMRARESEVARRCDTLAEALRALGPGSVQPLLNELRKEDAQIQTSAVSALVRLGPQIVPELVKALDESDSKVQAGSAFALGGIGVEAQRAIPFLLQLYSTDDVRVRQGVIFAIGRIDPRNAVVIRTSIRGADDRDVTVRRFSPSRPVNRIPQLAGSGQGGGAGRCKLQ